MKFREMFGEAKWVTPLADQSKRGCTAPYMRGRFTAYPSQKTELTICGLGWFELYINGKRYGDELFVPPISEYHSIPDRYCTVKYGERLGTRTYCKKYDITSYLNASGENVIGVFLGPGWYDTRPHTNRGISHYGSTRLCYKIESGDNVIYSDTDIKWKGSFVTGYNLHEGEVQDLSLMLPDNWSSVDFDDSDWTNTEECFMPATEYYFTECPPDRVIRSIIPKIVKETDEVIIYDAGENITGWPVIECDVPGEKVMVRCSEALGEDGLLDMSHYHRQSSFFTFTKENRKTHLRFTWNGFRFFELPKSASCELVEVVHMDVPVAAEFKSDSWVLNTLFDNFVRTQLCNMHSGIASDCPHIERHGYTGDGELVCPAGMLLFDSKEFYRKWIYDIADCQDRISGHVQYTAPYVHCGGGPGGWGCAIVEVPYQFYKNYGDIKPAEDLFDGMLRYFDYLEAHSENDLVTSDQPGLWCLGDWCTPEDIAIPEPFVNNYFYIKSINRVIELADIISRDVSYLKERLELKKKAVIDNYFDEATGDFCGNIQGANAFAFDIGLGDERTFDNMVKHYEEYGMYDTGIFGTDIVTRILFENGKEALAVKLLTNEKEYSFATQFKHGATTLWEYWTPLRRSYSHPMFGAVTKYLFTGLLGIKQAGKGYESIVVDNTGCFDVGVHAEGTLTLHNGLKISAKI